MGRDPLPPKLRHQAVADLELRNAPEDLGMQPGTTDHALALHDEGVHPEPVLVPLPHVETQAGGGDLPGADPPGAPITRASPSRRQNPSR